MKKILMIILAMMISVTSLPFYAFADDVSETAAGISLMKMAGCGLNGFSGRVIGII